jgi:flagellar hook-length control protein FliK
MTEESGRALGPDAVGGRLEQATNPAGAATTARDGDGRLASPAVPTPAALADPRGVGAVVQEALAAGASTAPAQAVPSGVAAAVAVAIPGTAQADQSGPGAAGGPTGAAAAGAAIGGTDPATPAAASTTTTVPAVTGDEAAGALAEASPETKIGARLGDVGSSAGSTLGAADEAAESRQAPLAAGHQSADELPGASGTATGRGGARGPSSVMATAPTQAAATPSAAMATGRAPVETAPPTDGDPASTRIAAFDPNAVRPAATPSAAPHGVRLATPAEAVVATVRLATTRGFSHARLALNPPEIGGVEVLLRSSSSGVVATLTADSPEAARLLQDAAGDLRQQLESSGIELLRLDVGVAGEGRGGDERSEFPGEPRQHGADVADTPEPAQPRRLELGGGVLIDVIA